MANRAAEEAAEKVGVAACANTARLPPPFSEHMHFPKTSIEVLEVFMYRGNMSACSVRHLSTELGAGGCGARRNLPFNK